MSQSARDAYYPDQKQMPVGKVWRVVAGAAAGAQALALLLIGWAALQVDQSDVAEKQLLLRNVSDLEERRGVLVQEVGALNLEMRRLRNAQSDATDALARQDAETKASKIAKTRRELRVEFANELLKSLSAETVGGMALSATSFDTALKDKAEWRRSIIDYYPMQPEEQWIMVKNAAGQWLSRVPFDAREIADGLYRRFMEACPAIPNIDRFRFVGDRPDFRRTTTVEQAKAEMHMRGIEVIEYDFDKYDTPERRLYRYHYDLAAHFINAFNATKAEYEMRILGRALECAHLTNDQGDPTPAELWPVIKREQVSMGFDQDSQDRFESVKRLMFREDLPRTNPNRYPPIDR